jgi:hypothetical protein
VICNWKNSGRNEDCDIISNKSSPSNTLLKLERIWDLILCRFHEKLFSLVKHFAFRKALRLGFVDSNLLFFIQRIQSKDFSQDF